MNENAATTVTATRLATGLLLGGAVLLAVGSFLPWAEGSVTLPDRSLDHTVGGIDGDGPIVLVAAVALAVLGWLRRSKGPHRARDIGAAVAAGIASLLVVVDLVDLNRVAAGEMGVVVDLRVGVGLGMATAGAVVALAGAALGLRDTPSPGPAAPTLPGVSPEA